MSIQDRANEWYANNVSPQSEYPDGALWTWSEVATFASLEREAAVREFAKHVAVNYEHGKDGGVSVEDVMDAVFYNMFHKELG